MCGLLHFSFRLTPIRSAVQCEPYRCSAYNRNRTGCMLQRSDEQSFASCLVGVKMQSAAGVGYTPRRIDVHRQQFRSERVFYEINHQLVFLLVVGACAVYHQTARLKRCPCRREYLPLAFGALSHILPTPLRDCNLVLAEHALAGAWRINKHCVKHRPQRGERRRVARCDHGICPAPLRYVLRQNVRTLAHILVTHQERAFGQRVEQKRGLAAPGRSDQDEKFTVRHFKGEPVHRRSVSARVDLVHSVEYNCRHKTCSGHLPGGGGPSPVISYGRIRNRTPIASEIALHLS